MDSMSDISEIVEDKVLLERLKESILLLSGGEQMLIRKHYFQGIPEIELAKMYGISQQGTSKRLKKFEKNLKNDGGIIFVFIPLFSALEIRESLYIK